MYHPKLDFTSISSYNKSLNRVLQKRKEKRRDVNHVIFK